MYIYIYIKLESALGNVTWLFYFFQGLIPHDSDTKRLAEDLDSNIGNVILSKVDLSSNSLIFFSMLLSISLTMG